MKVHLVSVMGGIDNLGFRKISSSVVSRFPGTGVSFIVPGNYRNPLNTILARGEARLSPGEVDEIATTLSRSDVVGFSSMSGYAPLVTEIIASIRQKSPDTIIVWGGIHAIMEPEDAILHADFACTGEGEFAFVKFLETLENGGALEMCRSFWCRSSTGVVRNPNLPLMTSEEMTGLPHPTHQDDETIYKKGKGFVPMTPRDFIGFNGICYPLIWTIGCPMRCTYCGNSKFIDYDSAYSKFRHSSVDTIISEIRRAKEKHPFISEIIFHDDSFMALPFAVLKEFSAKYKAEIDLPFAVVGVIPNYVREDKIEILLEAGMNRIRMGIQSGSQRILDFYQRPTPIKKIKDACLVINKYVKYMIPPAFDIILDNPIEKREDTLDTIDLVYDLPRPFTLNIFSLRIIPNTVLAQRFHEEGMDAQLINNNYWRHTHSLGNCLIYLSSIYKIPRKWFELLRRYIKPSHEDQRRLTFLSMVLRTVYLFKRAMFHLRVMDFSTIPGWTGYFLWKINFINWWRHNFVLKYRR